ncbi:hypothetical protein ETU08_09140 [Apibacter muscae]|uniref:hypothetical protein n=1 Tax=Apibacter muscae TaxID=2509004 RepID=UPI0011AD6C4A|nr:hypothetical protein [Apibacter muscae]TWP28352.1 hypothetical protein ETU08_09140 [Apibacter muscae]
MKSKFFIVLTIFLLVKVPSQNNQGTREYNELEKENINNKEKIYFLKAYSLNYCLYTNYRNIDLDTTLAYNDFSSLKLGDESGRNDKLLYDLRKYITSKTDSFYIKGSTYYSERGIPNLIFYDCYQFYESKELKKYIKNLLKEESNL